MKKGVIFLSIIAVMVAAYIVLFPENNPVKKLFTKKPLLPADDLTGTTTPKENPAGGEYRLGFPLAKGSKGSYVFDIQAALNRKFNTNLAVDGIFGPKTYRALSVSGFNPGSISFEDYKKIIA